MKTIILKTALLVALGALQVSQAAAQIIANGDFSAGNTGFSSDYSYGNLGNAQTYAIGTDPNNYNGNWPSSLGGVTPTAGSQFMIVNGATANQQTVWSENVTLTAGQSYVFTALVASLYPANSPDLNFYVGNVVIGSITINNAGDWELFSATFTATGPTTVSIVDTDTQYSGNDFALTDLAIPSAIPESPTVMAGALMLLPLGIGALRAARRGRTV